MRAVVFELLSLLGLTLPLVVGGVWAVFKFVSESKKNREQRALALAQAERDLTWQRTKFLFELSDKIAKDEDIQHCIRLLSIYDPARGNAFLSEVFSDSQSDIEGEVARTRHQFDKLFSFLDDIYYCYERNVFLSDEVKHFGYNVYLIDRCKPASDYCLRHGFHRVLKLRDVVNRE